MQLSGKALVQNEQGPGFRKKISSMDVVFSVMAEAHGTSRDKGKKGCKSQRKQTGEQCGTLTFRYDIAVSLLNFQSPWLAAKFSTRLGLPCPL